MAAQPPPAPTPAAAQPSTAPATPQKSGGCFGRGCGCSCLGCLGVFTLAALLVLGSGYWFFVVQASAAVTAPAALIVFNQPVTVNDNPGIPGESLNAGDQVATQAAGHAEIQFPDGSYVRLAPSTTVQISSVQLQRGGALQTASVLQKAGRTLMNVQHLTSGASFKVGGHSVSAEVRGTQFEVLVRPDGTNLIKVFDGTVTVSGKQTRQVKAGQEIDADANGNLSAVRAIRRDTDDPYALAAECARAVSQGTTPGTLETFSGDPISTGQNAEVDYDSSGGVVSVALCYPGSFMTLSVIDPTGVVHDNRNGASPVTGHIQGPGGRWRAIVHAITVSPPEAYAVAFATNAPCVASDGGSSDTGTVVRETLSNSQLARSLADSGASGVTIQVQGTSSTSARLFYYSNFGGTPISWTIVFYAATPNLGAVITQVTVRGVNVTTQVLRYIGSYGGTAISSIPSGFTVDRVYSCTAINGDDMMVIEGHR